jgi:hypothetical protein
VTCVIIYIFFFNLSFRCLHLLPIYSETWILRSSNLYFLWPYMLFYHFCKDFHETIIKFSNTYVISAQFLNYTFKLRINWHAAAVLSILNWTSSKHIVFSYNFVYCLHIIHIICHTQWNTLSELPTPVHSYNTVASSGPVSVDQPGTVHIIWHRKMSTTCIESIHNSCLQ